MTAVQGLDDLRLAARAEDRQHVVAVIDEGQHGGCLRLGRVSPQIEVISGVRSERLDLVADRSTIGKSVENDVPVADDATASGLHAVLERFAAGWCVTDLGSSNGTWVNGERIWASRRLRHGDEIRVGQTRLVFPAAGGAAGAPTEVGEAPPTGPRRERDVLVALCRPLLARDIFTEPASTRAMADELVITQAA